MDTRTLQTTKVDVTDQLLKIKTCMPRTYEAINQKADTDKFWQARKPGLRSFVRRGLAGEPNCFYAFEAGHVVGTPFTLAEVNRNVAEYMVSFGVSHLCVWPEPLHLPATSSTNT